MTGMFFDAESFNQPLDFNTGNVKDMAGMFYKTISFNQPLNFTDTSSVEVMLNMFNNALSFNQDISGWDVSAVTAHNKFDKDTLADWTWNEKPTFP